MSHCCICGFKKDDKDNKYEPAQYHDLRLLRLFDRRGVCSVCHQTVSTGDLLVLHTQLPLRIVKRSIPRGLFATVQYRVHDFICEYTGEVIKDLLEAYDRDSKFIVNRFYGDVRYDKQTFIDGDCPGKFVCVCECL